MHIIKISQEVINRKLIKKIIIIIFLLIIYPETATSEQTSVNLITNPSIEQGENHTPKGWSTKIDRLAPQFTWDNKTVRTGQHSLHIKGPGSGCWYITVPIHYGKKYRVSYYFKTRSVKDNNQDANTYVYLIKQNQKKGAGAVQWINDFNMRNVPNWSKVTMVEYVAEEGDKSLTLELWLNGNRAKISDKDESKVWFDDISIEEIDCPPEKNPNYLITQNNDFILTASAGTENIYKSDSITNLSSINKIKINAARGETRGFQLSIRPQVKLDKIKWEGEDFVGPSVFAKQNLKYYRVEYITLPGRQIPDPLPLEGVSLLRANENNPFYIIVKIPDNAKKGIYRTNLKLKEGKNIIAKVPIEVNVWDFKIPQNPTIEMYSDVWPHILSHYEKGELNDILKRYLSNLAEHRAVTPLGGLKIKIVEKKPMQKEIELDSKDLEGLLAHEKKLGLCQNIIIHQAVFNFFNNTFMGMPIFKDNESDEYNPKFVSLITDVIKKLNGLLEKEGCLNSFGVQISDEPNIRDKSVVRFIKGIAQSFKTADPRIRIFSTGAFHKDFAPNFDRWYFNNLGIPFVQEEIKILERKGTKGIYLNNITDPSVPPLKLRLLIWALWKEHYAGFYWWQINGWGYNTPQGFVKVNPWEGKFKGIVFIYPPREGSAEEGPINSLHWEALREGMEDIEYLGILSKLLKEKRGKIPEALIERGRKALARINDIVDHVPIGGEIATDTFHTTDVALVEEVKSEIALVIEEINSYGRN